MTEATIVATAQELIADLTDLMNEGLSQGLEMSFNINRDTSRKNSKYKGNVTIKKTLLET